jgi:hypothetical protein
LVSMGKAGLVKFLVTFLDIGNFCIIFGYWKILITFFDIGNFCIICYMLEIFA